MSWIDVPIKPPEIILPKPEITDYSKIFFFPNAGLPFNLRAFAGDRIEIGGNLRPDVNNYLQLSSNLINIAYIHRHQALTTSGASEIHSVEFTPIELIPPDVSDDLSISGGGIYFVYIKSLGTKKNLLDYKMTRYSPVYTIHDTTLYSTNSTTYVEVFRINLGNVYSLYLHNLNSLANTGTTGYYKIQYSTDGETWYDLVERSAYTETLFLERFYVTAQFLRWLYRSASSGYYTQLRIRKVWVIG